MLFFRNLHAERQQIRSYRASTYYVYRTPGLHIAPSTQALNFRIGQRLAKASRLRGIFPGPSKNNRLQVRSCEGGAINLDIKGLNLRFANPMVDVWPGQQGHNALKHTSSNATQKNFMLSFSLPVLFCSPNTRKTLKK